MEVRNAGRSQRFAEGRLRESALAGQRQLTHVDDAADARTLEALNERSDVEAFVAEGVEVGGGGHDGSAGAAGV